jgi:hypothetical protein
MVPPLLAEIYRKNRGFFHRVIRDVLWKNRNSASFFEKVTLFLSQRGWKSVQPQRPAGKEGAGHAEEQREENVDEE